MPEYLLKKGNFIFSKVLRNGYIILEDSPIILNTATMADGSEKRNYSQKTKTIIQINIADLSGLELKTYLSNLVEREAIFEYWSPRDRIYKQKKFFVEIPEIEMIYSFDGEKYENFELSLESCGE